MANVFSKERDKLMTASVNDFPRPDFCFFVCHKVEMILLKSEAGDSIPCDALRDLISEGVRQRLSLEAR